MEDKLTGNKFISIKIQFIVGKTNCIQGIRFKPPSHCNLDQGTSNLTSLIQNSSLFKDLITIKRFGRFQRAN
jgi:hypothetical protein